MPVEAIISIAWAAVHGYLVLYHGFIYGRRRVEREYRAYALLSLCFAVHALGTALLVSSQSVAGAVHGQTLQVVGASLAAPQLLEFSQILTGAPDRRLLAVTRTWCMLSAGLCAAGLFFDPADAAPANARGLMALPDHGAAVLSPCGLAFVAGIVALVIVGLARVATRSARTAVARTLLLLTLVVVAGGAHDVLVHLLPFRSVQALPHVALFFAGAAALLLLRRFLLADEQLARQTFELGRSYDALRRVQEDLVVKEQLAAVGSLSAVIAHEVRNPLAILKNAISGLRRPSLEAQDRATLGSIVLEETERLGRLVDALLDYAQPVGSQRRSVAVLELVQGAVEAARRLEPQPGVEVSLCLSDVPESVECDPDMLGKALTNVLVNALQAVEGGGTVTVSSRPPNNGGPGVVLSVADTGTGMDALARSRARDPFFTTRARGTGLGLAIADRVVRAHGGTLDIESRHGVGTTVTLSIRPRSPSSPPPNG